MKLDILTRLDDVLRDLDDELIDKTLAAGQPDEPEYVRCPLCDCDWHALSCRPHWWEPEDDADSDTPFDEPWDGFYCRCESSLTALDDTWRPLRGVNGVHRRMHDEGLDGYTATALRSRGWIELKTIPRPAERPEPADWGQFLRYVNDLARHDGPIVDLIALTIAHAREQWTLQAIGFNSRAANDFLTITLTSDTGESGSYTLAARERVAATYQPDPDRPSALVSQKIWLYRPDGSVHRIRHDGLVCHRDPAPWPDPAEEAT